MRRPPPAQPRLAATPPLRRMSYRRELRVRHRVPAASGERRPTALAVCLLSPPPRTPEDRRLPPEIRLPPASLGARSTSNDQPHRRARAGRRLRIRPRHGGARRNPNLNRGVARGSVFSSAETAADN